MPSSEARAAIFHLSSRLARCRNSAEFCFWLISRRMRSLYLRIPPRKTMNCRCTRHPLYKVQFPTDSSESIQKISKAIVCVHTRGWYQDSPEDAFLQDLGFLIHNLSPPPHQYRWYIRSLQSLSQIMDPFSASGSLKSASCKVLGTEPGSKSGPVCFCAKGFIGL